ncbi:MAG: hypothetical protein [Circular genetic element sp.]|nr:MAG: hypothetical protein [Circular genetic element sp.]
MNSTFFEIGGELIELKADYEYGQGQISASKRKQQRATAKDVKSIGKSMDKMSKKTTSDDGWGPAEKVGYGVGLAAGIAFAVVTFPVVVADSPMIGPADLAWFAASARMIDRTTTLGQKSGAYVDESMGWD